MKRRRLRQEPEDQADNAGLSSSPTVVPRQIDEHKATTLTASELPAPEPLLLRFSIVSNELYGHSAAVPVVTLRKAGTSSGETPNGQPKLRMRNIFVSTSIVSSFSRHSSLEPAPFTYVCSVKDVLATAAEDLSASVFQVGPDGFTMRGCALPVEKWCKKGKPMLKVSIGRSTHVASDAFVLRITSRTTSVSQDLPFIRIWNGTYI